MAYTEAKGKTLSRSAKREPALDHLRVHPREDGGYVVAHVYDDGSDEDHYHYDSQDEMIGHVKKATPSKKGVSNLSGRASRQPGDTQANVGERNLE